MNQICYDLVHKPGAYKNRNKKADMAINIIIEIPLLNKHQYPDANIYVVRIGSIYIFVFPDEIKTGVFILLVVYIFLSGQ